VNDVLGFIANDGDRAKLLPQVVLPHAAVDDAEEFVH